MAKIAYICSGGQTGVDRAALDCAKKHKVNIVGWCPKNGWAEDFLTAPGLTKVYKELKETPSSETKQRTYWNVRDSHATLIIMPKSSSMSGGTNLTEEAAKHYKKPYLVVSSIEDIDLIFAWLNTIGDEITLNVGGPRASECPSAYSIAFSIVEKILTILK